MKRVFIIHGWSDSPLGGWFPWLKKELMTRGYEVHVPAMPDADHPAIDTWVPFLRHAVGQSDNETYFVGHSIGCQTIMRYLETLPADTVVGGVVLVGGWVTLKPEALEDDEAVAIGGPWLQRPLHWPIIRARAQQFTAIMSDDDQFVPLDDKDVFQRELGAKMIIEHHKKHMSGDDGVTILASALRAVEEMVAK
ncbi:MAG: alpha/beta hydrolase [Candidatus Kerfeldbacteria bacterium]|nr:alpha/beta hydrolase [Candidatus Kerfeldbacteria bacterium]